MFNRILELIRTFGAVYVIVKPTDGHTCPWVRTRITFEHTDPDQGGLFTFEQMDSRFTEAMVGEGLWESDMNVWAAELQHSTFTGKVQVCITESISRATYVVDAWGLNK